MRDEDEVNLKIDELEKIQSALKPGEISQYLKLANFIKALQWVNEYGGI